MPEEGKGNQWKNDREEPAQLAFLVALSYRALSYIGRGESKKQVERGLEWGSEKTVSHLLHLQKQCKRTEVNQKSKNVEHDGPSRKQK